MIAVLEATNTKTPSAETLRDRIKALEAEIARLKSQRDQADADAVAKIGQEAEYQKAARKVDELCGELERQRGRLTRLRTALGEQTEAEWQQRLAMLEESRRRLESTIQEKRNKTVTAKRAEIVRHRKALVDLDRSLAEAEIELLDLLLEIDGHHVQAGGHLRELWWGTERSHREQRGRMLNVISEGERFLGGRDLVDGYRLVTPLPCE